MVDIDTSLEAATERAQQKRAHIRHRLFGMKFVSDSSFPSASDAPVEVHDSASMETRPLRRR